MRQRFHLIVSVAALAMGLLLSAPSVAQSTATAGLGLTPQIQGKSLDGRPFNISSYRGRVVLVMFWATDCAVCRDKMPELRENAKGWKSQPFSAILISVDRKMSDVDAYNAVINASVPASERLTQIWAADPIYKDSLNTQELIKSRTTASLPLTFVLDKSGQIVKRYQGRIPSDVWNDVADLL